MIIILEGIDKTGKTTLANLISKRYGFEIVKCSQPKGDPYIEYMTKLHQAEGKNVVFDRFYLGELAYGPVFRGKTQLSSEQCRNIELKAMSQGCIVIYCYDIPSKISERFKSDGETFAKDEHIQRLMELYSRSMLETNLPVIYHQMKTDHDMTKNLKMIIDELKDITPTHVIKKAVGNQLNPKLILIGDKRNNNLDNKILNRYKSVSQVFDFGKSSTYLFNELKLAKFEIKDVMLVNQVDLKKDDIDFLSNLERKSAFILSLGKNAKNKLKKLSSSLVFFPINHPQYEVRFRPRSHKLSNIFKELNYVRSYQGK